MSKLPVISGRDLVKYLSKKGFHVKRIRGDHCIMQGEGRRPFPVPLHDELDRGTLSGILEQAGISSEQFIQDQAGK